MRKLLHIIFLLDAIASLTIVADGQQPHIPRKPVVRFSYDASGNVVARTVTLEVPYWEWIFDDSIPVDTGIIAYPNPTFGPLNAEAKNYTGEFPLRYEIYNDKGMLVRTVTSMQEVTDVSIDDNTTGNYVLRALRGDSVIAIKILKLN